MRRILIILHTLIALFFACSLGYTLVAKGHLENLARSFAVEKTIEYGDPVVGMADVSLRLPGAKKVLTDDQITSAKKEINSYRADRKAYIGRLTRTAKESVANSTEHPILAKVTGMKNRIAVHYNDTIDALVEDFRIFATSNLVAAMIALVFAWQMRGRMNNSFLALSLVLMFTLVYGVVLYIDNLSFFKILFKIHLGWLHPVLLSVPMICVGVEYVRFREIAHEFNSDA